MLTKEISYEVNRYDASIHSVITTWRGYNNRGEFVYHSKTVTYHDNINLMHFCYYIPALDKCVFRDIRI